MTDPDQYESVRILRLQPGDVLVVRLDADITRQQAHDIRQELKPKFPDNEVLVLGRGVDVEIFRAEEPPTHTFTMRRRVQGQSLYDQLADYANADDPDHEHRWVDITKLGDLPDSRHICADCGANGPDR